MRLSLPFTLARAALLLILQGPRCRAVPPLYSPHIRARGYMGFRTQPTRVLALLLSLLALAVLAPARADSVAKTPRIAVRLVAASTGVPASGGSITLGLQQHMERGWHTYW